MPNSGICYIGRPRRGAWRFKFRQLLHPAPTQWRLASQIPASAASGAHQQSGMIYTPDEEVADHDRCQGEGDADPEEVPEADLVAFLPEHADARDIG